MNDKYELMRRLAGGFDDVAAELRHRSATVARILDDPAFVESAGLSRRTFGEAEEAVEVAAGGAAALTERAGELEADALVLRATVRTYEWIDELAEAAYRTLGSIAGRAVDYLAPQVELGGDVLTAGVIETDVLDRDGVASYLSELAAAHPDLAEHLTSGGGGLLEALTMRALLGSAALARLEEPAFAEVASAGIERLLGEPFDVDAGAAIRDIAGPLVPTAGDGDPVPGDVVRSSVGGPATASLAELFDRHAGAEGSIEVDEVGADRFVVHLTGRVASPGRMRLVGAEAPTRANELARRIEEVCGDGRVMLVGAGAGGAAAARIASSEWAFTVDQVITASAPQAHVPRLPASVRMLAIENRGDPVALLGSLVNASAGNRVTVMVDPPAEPDEAADTASLGVVVDSHVAAAAQVDASDNPEIQAELNRLRRLGYLT